MKKPEDLTHDELVALVRAVQGAMSRYDAYGGDDDGELDAEVVEILHGAGLDVMNEDVSVLCRECVETHKVALLTGYRLSARCDLCPSEGDTAMTKVEVIA